MLDRHDQTEVVAPVRGRVKERARLPIEVHEFLAKEGALPAVPGCRRGYQRKYFRAPAVMNHQGEFYGIYMCDISRSGVGFYSPVQLLPDTGVTLWLPQGHKLDVTTRTCVRHANNSYRCGAVHSTGGGD